MMGRGYRRMIDPEGPAIQIKEQRMGVISQRDLRRDQNLNERFQIEIPQLIVTVALIPWFRENIAANTTSTMRIEIPDTGPAFAATGVGASIKTGGPGRIIGGELKCNASVTAGNAWLAVRIGGIDYPLSDIVANTTNPTGIVNVVPWLSGIPFAEEDTLQPTIITDASFAPAGSIDMKAMLIAAYPAI